MAEVPSPQGVADCRVLGFRPPERGGWSSNKQGSKANLRISFPGLKTLFLTQERSRIVVKHLKGEVGCELLQTTLLSALQSTWAKSWSERFLSVVEPLNDKEQPVKKAAAENEKPAKS